MTPRQRVRPTAQPRMVEAWARRRGRLCWRVPLVKATFRLPPMRYGVLGRPVGHWCNYGKDDDHPLGCVVDYSFLRPSYPRSGAALLIAELIPATIRDAAPMRRAYPIASASSAHPLWGSDPPARTVSTAPVRPRSAVCRHRELR